MDGVDELRQRCRHSKILDDSPCLLQEAAQFPDEPNLPNHSLGAITLRIEVFDQHRREWRKRTFDHNCLLSLEEASVYQRL